VTVHVPIEEASVMLISDASGSMAATDVSPTRLDAARRAAHTFVKRVPEELRVGLVGFSDSPQTVLRPTLDRDTLNVTLDSLEAGGGTATGDAIQTALGNIGLIDDKKKHPPAAIVLLSDGKTTAGSDPVQAAREAGRLNIPIYTIALGTPDGVVPGGFGGYIPVPPDPETLREIARVSRGQAFTAEDSDELDGIYERLGRQIGTKPQQREVTAGFAGAGLVFLLAAVGTGVWWRSRLV
jgi:Ca-activated chloride channel family protein